MILGKKERLDLIKKIQEKRESKLITYVLSDRPGFSVHIGSDTPRIFYEHLDNDNGEKIPRIDLFLYSAGGDTSAPWRIISLLREFADEVNVLIPYRAYSAATLISMGTDNILMGKKGELGPIDPTVNSEFNPVDPTISNKKMSINVEDITSYFELIKKAGIKEQAELGKSFTELTNAVNPVALGYVNRHYSFIRMVATKLLESHNKPCSSEQIEGLVKELIEKIYFHGHGISRSEAKKIGLNIIHPDKETESLMWQLFLDYEEDLALNNPLIAEDFLDERGVDNHILRAVSGGYIESDRFSHIFHGDVKMNAVRATPQQLNVNVNFQLPAGNNPGQLNEQQLQELQQQIHQMVLQEINSQSPIAGYNSHLTKLNWHKRKW